MKKVGATKGVTYLSVEKDRDGYVDARKYIPVDFDICTLKIKDKKEKPGWAVKMKFYGMRIDPEDEILAWKKCRDPK